VGRRRERIGMGRKEKREREGAGGDARTVRRSNTCGEMREREREGNGEKYGAKTAGRWMKESGRGRERIENERSDGEQ
jgi:hypothetical protein